MSAIWYGMKCVFIWVLVCSLTLIVDFKTTEVVAFLVAKIWCFKSNARSLLKSNYMLEYSYGTPKAIIAQR